MALCACAHMLPRLPWLYFELFKQQVQLKTLNIIIADAWCKIESSLQTFSLHDMQKFYLADLSSAYVC